MEKFLNYLINKKISKETLKNYKSDATHFFSWLTLKVRSFGSYIESFEEAIPFLSTQVTDEYLNYLEMNNIPLKTINRRLSTLRNLSAHLLNEGLIEIDFMNGVSNKKIQIITKNINYSEVVDEFRSFLEAQNVSSATIKNYTSDIRQFVTWLEKNPTYAQTS